jgi:hypothetical protein
MLLLSVRAAWFDHFPGTNPYIYSQEYGERQTPSASFEGGVYVLNSLFNKCSSWSYGGALSCTSVTYLLIESSSFFSCKTGSQRGGAIYFYNSNDGQSILRGVCGNDCHSTYQSTSYSSSYGHFAYTLVKDAVSSRNYVNYSSIVRCVSEKYSTYHILHLWNGKIYCPSDNISLNKCYSQLFLGYSVIDSNYPTFLTLYSSFTDNNASHNVLINIGGSGNAKRDIKCCNIIRNTQVYVESGLIYAGTNLTIEDSCIIEDNASYYFEPSSSGYTITLSNCTVDKTTKIGKLTIQNTVTKSFILTLYHISTQNCHAEYTFAIPHPNKRLFYYSCQNYQYILSDFFTLTRMFIISFIHSDPSNELYTYCAITA